MNEVTKSAAPVRRQSRTKSIARVGVMIAICAVCAWIEIPLGPVPFTLQTFALTLALCVLPPREALAVAFGYVLIGALGLPVFSGFKGGIGILAGYTGGYIVGYLVGMPIACAVLYAARRSVADDIKRRGELELRPSNKLYTTVNIGYMVFAGLLFSIAAYTVGTIWYAQVANVSWEVAFTVCIVPFIVPDILKIVAAVACAQALDKTLGLRN